MKNRQPTVSVVIPALNEEASIGWVMNNIPTWVDEVILVDGLSVDQTTQVARHSYPEIVIVHETTRGKGAALRAGFAAASKDIIVMLDADGSTNPQEIHRFIEALSNDADFVKGSRNLSGGGSTDFTPLRHFGNLIFVWITNILFFRNFTDICYGYCAFWKKDLQKLDLTADGFEIEMELVLSAAKAKMTIVEVPSFELERRAGSSNLNAWKDGKQVLKTLLKKRFTRSNSKNQTLIRNLDWLIDANVLQSKDVVNA